tara:strand:- start:533 stop:1297 length:765 start_codon:yes stop_codon:yes gene_type:complete
MTIIIFLILINLILIYFLYRKEIKKFFIKKQIKEVNIEEVHEIFKTNETNKNFPSEDYITKLFIVPNHFNVVGMTSDFEAWILSMLSKISKNIFEFGTCSGKTTYLMALNSSNDTRINTLTLKLSEQVKKKSGESKTAYKNIFNESIYEKFMFTNTKEEEKINVHFVNSLEFDERNFKQKCDLIFIDGGHTYSIIKSDSDKAFKMIKKNGYIIWHDYVAGKRSSRDVFKYLNEINKNKKLFSIKGTSLVYFLNE